MTRLLAFTALLALALSSAALWHLIPLWSAEPEQWVRLGTLGALVPFVFALAALVVGVGRES